MSSGSLHERITRALAFMLRHQPEDFDLELDKYGWGDLEDVIYALQERLGSSVDEDDVLDAIEASDRPRYEVDEDRIRALYGHSFPIDPGEPTEPPDELYIGVGSRDAERAEENGLRSGRRAFLHLARTEDEAREAGRRAAKDYAVITVYAGEAYDEGIDFYDRGALFLADEVPTEFLEVGDIQHDGIEREPRRSRGRRNHDGPRGRSRGRGRGRGRGRDDEDRGRGRGDRDRDDRDRDDRDRNERSRSERPREDRSRERQEDVPAAPPRREREEAPSRAGEDGGFGLGLDSSGSPKQDKPKRSSAKKAAPKREREEAPKEAPAEAAPEAPKERKPASPGFGAGL